MICGAIPDCLYMFYVWSVFLSIVIRLKVENTVSRNRHLYYNIIIIWWIMYVYKDQYIIGGTL